MWTEIYVNNKPENRKDSKENLLLNMMFGTYTGARNTKNDTILPVNSTNQRQMLQIGANKS